MLEGNVQLVQHYQADGRVLQQLTGHRPGRFGSGDVALAVLGFPSETFAHHMKAHLLREATEEQFLASAVATLDELHHAALHTVAHGPGEHAERGTALAFAIAGQHQQQTAFIGGIGDALVDHGFLAQHARQVAFVTVGGISHGSSPLGLDKNGGQEKDNTDSQASPTVMLLDAPGRSPGS